MGPRSDAVASASASGSKRQQSADSSSSRQPDPKRSSKPTIVPSWRIREQQAKASANPSYVADNTWPGWAPTTPPPGHLRTTPINSREGQPRVADVRSREGQTSSSSTSQWQPSASARQTSAERRGNRNQDWDSRSLRDSASDGRRLGNQAKDDNKRHRGDRR